ncbi:hypothetical protein [Haloarchaeobius sp. TZWSO28]|uniref:hypothetical protein n=1 Tax=Haloarchaeobius sp. TZWSO28 TaxID=3446119 RepID=UPI003EBD1991
MSVDRSLVETAVWSCIAGSNLCLGLSFLLEDVNVGLLFVVLSFGFGALAVRRHSNAHEPARSRFVRRASTVTLSVVLGLGVATLLLSMWMLSVTLTAS